MKDKHELSSLSFRVIDALVAEHVLGWTDITFVKNVYESTSQLQGVKADEKGSPYTGARTKFVIPNYSTDISAAWEIVRSYENRFRFVITLGEMPIHYDAIVVRHNGMGDFTEWKSKADTASMAICLTALKVVGYMFATNQE